MTKSRSLFLRKFLAAPAKIGSITPSSKYLVKKMFRSLAWNDINSIVELGAGTGVFTEYISQHEKKNCQTFIIEQDCYMRQQLAQRFPNMKFGEQADNFPCILKTSGLTQVDCIISGLPFAMLNRIQRNRILYNIWTSLKENGIFVAFQYSPYMYRSFSQHFSRVDLSLELRNVPPAFVYRCQK